MLPNTRLTLLAIAAVLALQFPSARAGAQSPPASVSQVDEEMTINVPFTFHKLAASITSIGAGCMVFNKPQSIIAGGIPLVRLAQDAGPRKPVSTLTTSAGGNISGTVAVVHKFKRNADLTGLPGAYRCYLNAAVQGGAVDIFSQNSSDPRFKMAGKNEIDGTFTW